MNNPFTPEAIARATASARENSTVIRRDPRMAQRMAESAQRVELIRLEIARMHDEGQKALAARRWRECFPGEAAPWAETEAAAAALGHWSEREIGEEG